MTSGNEHGVGPGPSLSDQAGGMLRRLSGRATWPASYAPALIVLALLPGVAALLAGGAALVETQRNGVLLRIGASRIAAIAAARDRAGARAAMAPYYTAPTLTGALAEIVALLPSDATLHAITREADGVTRIEVDCPDPDALRRAFRAPPSRIAWRSIAQTVTAGAGVRVTLEAAAR